MEQNEYRIMFEMEQSHWWFIGKQFLLDRILQGLPTVRESQMRGMDIGCGTGINLRILGKYGTPFGVEYSPEALRFLKRRRIRLLARADVNRSLPFRSGSFSLVTCLDVLEHLEEDRALLLEMARVCQPGGYLIVTVPAFRLLWSPHDESLHHRRRYNRVRFREMVKGMGCDVVRLTYFNVALFLPILMVRRMRRLLPRQGRARSDFSILLPGRLNRLLQKLYVLEMRLLEMTDFPFGVSLMCILRKRYPEGR